MTERDPYSVEAGQGARPPTTSGDRLMLVLAVVALVGGLLIAVNKLVGPDPSVVAEITPAPTALPSPSRSRTARPSPTARPLGQLLVEPGEPPANDNGEDWFERTWVRAREEVIIRAIPQPDGFRVGALPAGGVAISQAAPDGSAGVEGWLWLAEPEPAGWIEVQASSGQLVDLLPPSSSGGVDLWEAYGGDAGFIALGEADGSPFIATSPDGVAWRRRAAPIPWGYQGGRLAWGPAGWLTMMSGVGYDSRNSSMSASWVWQSADGESWSALGSLRDRFEDGWADSLAGSQTGYLVRLFSYGPPSWWFSPNGLSWSEMPPVGVSTDVVVGGSTGFYSWPGWDAAPVDTAGDVGVFTADGESWQRVRDGPAGEVSQVVPLGDRWLGMDYDPKTGAIRVWSGSVRDGEFSWDAPSEAPALEGSALALLTGDTRRAVAITWDRGTEELRAWTTSDGSSWTQISTPDGGFGEIPHGAVGSRAGVLVQGTVRVNDRETTRLWRLDGDRWQEIRSAAIAEQAAPPAACPPPPADALDLGLLGEGIAVRCFGDAPLTLRGYSVPEQHCYECGDDPFEPAWLSWSGEGLSLMPFETGNSWFQNTALDPSLEWSTEWDGAWVEVTGHFDDPAAQECRLELDPETEAWYAGRQRMIEDCRRRFVVTAVTVVDGP